MLNPPNVPLTVCSTGVFQETELAFPVLHAVKGIASTFGEEDRARRATGLSLLETARWRMPSARSS